MEGWFNEPKIRKIAFAFRPMRYKTKKAVEHSLLSGIISLLVSSYKPPFHIVNVRAVNDLHTARRWIVTCKIPIATVVRNCFMQVINGLKDHFQASLHISRPYNF